MVPTWKRIVAFTMDMILLLVLLQLLGEILPNAYPDQVKNEFDQLIINARHLSQQNESYLKQTTEFIGNSQFSPETYQMLKTMFLLACLIPTAYFFISELFFEVRLWAKQPFAYE